MMTAFTFYSLHVEVTNDYIDTIQDMQELDLKRDREEIEFISVSFTSHDSLNITVQNKGPNQVHLVWLGIFDEASNTQDYYKIDFYINEVETVHDIRNDTIPTFEVEERIIQLVSDLGNTFSYSYPEPSEDDYGAQASITITGTNSTAAYNPSQWNLLGMTQDVSGSASDLASNDASHAIFRSYNSGISNRTLLDDGFEGADWDANWDDNTFMWVWERDGSQQHSGSYSASPSDMYGIFVCDDLDASDADVIYIEFWYRLHDTEPSDLRIYYYNGISYRFIENIGGGSEDAWLHYTDIVTDSQFFVSNFRILFYSTLFDQEDVWLDDVEIMKQAGSEEYTADVEFTGSSNLEDWTRLDWQIDSCWSIGEVTVTIQFYNYILGGYVSGGNGYSNYVSDPNPETDELKSQTITLNPTDFRSPSGNWKVKIKGVKSTSTQFLMKVDWITFQPTYSSSGENIPYDTWQEYLIEAKTAEGDPIPYAYISIYGNGTNIAFRNAITEESVSNPGWAYVDAEGEYHLEVKSTHSSPETFILYVVAGSVVGQKTITQEGPV